MRQNYSNLRTKLVRFFLICCVALTSTQLFAVGWTPTDGGLVVNLEQGDQLLLSVWIDIDGDEKEDPGEEFFVNNYNRYTGGRFNYKAGYFLKLVPQDANADEPSEMSIWTVGAPLERGNYDLGGIVYTIWNDDKTLRAENNHYQFYGALTDNYSHNEACDVVFVVPTNRKGIVSFDPERTMGRGEESGTDELGVNKKGRFNGETGTGFLGMTYREVYWLEIPKSNDPRAYTNAALVTFNTTTSDVKWHAGTINPGKAAYAYADNTPQKPHHRTTRTIFRLYVLNDPINTCGSYFFATDVQNKNKKYRQSNTMNDSTDVKKIYTWDHLFCMEHVGDASSKIYKTGWMNVPEDDSTYYYVGKNNTYVNGGGTVRLDPTDKAVSQFKNIDSLRVDGLKAVTTAEGEPFIAPAGAYGRMVVDTSSTKQNLGVSFEPAGYFLKVSTGTNVRMKKTADNQWTSEEMWTITSQWSALNIKATLMTGPEFSPTDPGADIAGWSSFVAGTSVPVAGHTGLPVTNQSGYARITTNSADLNGHLEFILVDKTKHIHYDNNGFLGTQIPDQYPLEGATTLTVEASRLKGGYTFNGWNTQADGSGVSIAADQVLTFDALPEGVSWIGDTVINLYAQATYTGTYNVALSFMEGGQRYFMTHPGSDAPRYSRARHYDDWTNVWQGMANAENTDPLYLNTFELRYPIDEVKTYDPVGLAPLNEKERVLDPRRYVMHGAIDSLQLYENFSPSEDEYLGLYYTDPNTILANNTWAGLFSLTTADSATTTWPDFRTPTIGPVKLKSERYVFLTDLAVPDILTLMERGNKGDGSYVKYQTATNQFDGVKFAKNATNFQISTVVVADEHFIILPDTSKTWYDVIEFGYHENEQTTKDVWSALIGKQLMAAMIIDEDTIYFHPNRDKIINDPNALYLSKDFRVTQIFEFIPDSRVTTVVEDNRVSHATTDHYWHHTITSGKNSPINVQHNGQYIDIVDTFRLTLSHGGISKIKEYRGRWKRGAAGLHVSADGSSRSRDILITTKTYHYDAEQTRYVLKPEKESYSFGPLKGQTKRLNFILTQEHYHNLRDAEDHFVREEITTIDTLTSQLQMLPGYCTFTVDHALKVDAPNTNGSHVTIEVKDENTSGANYDTLVISQIQINGVDQAVNVRVPLVQAPLEGNELIWSVEYGGQRYYIMAAGGNLIYRRYRRNNNILYQLNTSTHLQKGYGTADEARKITPWAFDYVGEVANRQLTLQTKYGLNKYFAIDGSTPGLGDAAAKATLTYDYVNIYTNDNANFEEQVTLKYGSDQWLKFNGTALVLTTTESEASVFSWSYLQSEYYLQNNGTYPSREEAVFGYNSTSPVAIQTRYKAYRDSSMLVGNQLTYLCREDENDMADLINASGIWKTAYTIDAIRDHRTATSSGLNNVTNYTTLTTTVTPTGSSPEGTMDIVDTLRVRLSLQEGAPSYHFVGNWSGFNSISDANLKIPLIRKAYRTESYDSLLCKVQNDQYTYTFPATLGADDSTFVFTLRTERHTGSHVLDANDQMVAIISSSVIDSTHAMDLSDKSRAEVRLVDEFGNTPTWCRLVSLGTNTITVKCLQSGTRAPRSAYLYLAYIVSVTKDARTEIRFINIRLTVSQVSRFDYANNQHLVHSSGASGDPLVDGFQQVHENRRILYYYPEQEVELPVRERGFYGWWRWYQISEEADKDDSDIPTGDWAIAPTNTGKYNYPFRVIGDSVWNDENDHSKGKKLVTQGRYTVFHYKSKDYGNKNDPPAKSPRVVPPTPEFGGDKPTVTYAVDLSTYYDNLPMSLRYKNQVDTALMDTMRTIVEPTLSLREIFELRPWTEMAARLEGFKDTIDSDHRNLKYMEDHVVMAPLDNQLLLSTEQRYNYANLAKDKHSESLLGYYMRDDNWSTWSETPIRQDTMIWCGGWDADCKWYTYDPHASAGSEYTLCNHPITNSDDFLKVPAKTSITEGYKADTVYYCLRSRSKKTLPDIAGKDSTVDGDYWFNICRYEIIYHRTRVYGPKQEVRGKALITNDEIEQNYEVLERLNFDYNQPGPTYTVYPHPLPWADASYGYTYPETPDLPHNRYHDESDFPNNGEYGIVNRIPYTSWWNTMEQHGGAANGYMIYCDGMSSAGQVAALTLETNLCAGQKLFFSGYVGNPATKPVRPTPVSSSRCRVRWMAVRGKISLPT